MKTNEYFNELKKLDTDQIHPEFHTYATVWIRSRMPERYQELKAAFHNYEGEIYAAQQHEEIDF
jgi:Asp-tRNA(Asn)/Glu-tRNA(Gln) amidotransferase C subunit